MTLLRRRRHHSDRVASLLGVALALALCALPTQISADTLNTARGQAVVEVAHRVAVDIEDGVARMQVRRTFENRGNVTDQVELELQLPQGAAAVGLRIKGKDRWYKGMLMEARMASVVYQSLTGYGPWPVKDPAILFWNDLGQLGLWVFPVLPGQPSTVEYTLLTPVAYRGGRYYLSYPAAVQQAELAVPEVQLRSPGRDARFTVNGRKVAAGARTPLSRRMIAGEEDLIQDLAAHLELVNAEELLDELGHEGDDAFYADNGEALITATAPPIDTVDVRYATFSLSPGKRLLRLDIDAAAELRPKPRQASVVFVVDASHSFDEEGVAAALELCRAYVRHLDDARYEVVLFNRRATRLFGRFVRAAEWDATMEEAQENENTAPGNGSFVERGLELAAELLAGRRGPGRVVLVSDARLREHYDNALAAAALEDLSPRSVVHLVELTPGAAGDPAEPTRDDSHMLAPVALTHGGMLVALQSGSTAADFSSAALELVQPQRIHGFSVTSGGQSVGNLEAPDELFAGEALRYMDIAPEAPGAIAIQGRIWAEPLARVVEADPEWGGEILPALLFGGELHVGLEEVEMMRAAAAGKAVSPVTSYLSVEPGTRPSQDGFGEDVGLGGLGLRGVGAGGGGVAICGAAGHDRPDYRAALQQLANAAAAHCFAASERGARAAVWLECTLHEVVDLEVESSEDGELNSCLEEQLWEMRLPLSFVLPRFSATIGLSGPA